MTLSLDFCAGIAPDEPSTERLRLCPTLLEAKAIAVVGFGAAAFFLITRVAAGELLAPVSQISQGHQRIG